MLLDLEYEQDPPTPAFFRAQMQDGVIEVPRLQAKAVTA